MATLNDMYIKFKLDKELQGLSRQSISDYDNIVGIFLRFVGNVDCDALDKSVVDNYIRSVLYNKNITRNTAATYIRNAKIFLCWVFDNYDLPFNPHKIKVPKAPKKNVHMLTDNELSIIFNSICSSYPWITARNKAIVAVMLDSGIRQGEACTLLKSNMDFDRMVFKVTGKGAKERLVPLGNFSRHLIADYLMLCPYKTSDNVFVDRFGKPISGNAIRMFVYDLKEKTGIDLSSHKFRHNFATNYCIDNLQQNGSTNVYDLSIIMGHESIETTKRYEHFAHEMIAATNNISHLDLTFSKNQVFSDM